MRVQMKTLAAGPLGVFPAGMVREVSDSEAESLVDGGFADLVCEPVKPTTADESTPVPQVKAEPVTPKRKFKREESHE